MYIFVHPFFDDRIQIKYSKTEIVKSIDQIKHPIVREILRKFNIVGVDINSIADIPAGTGLGSSSSYTVGLINALYAYTKQDISSEILASLASEIEIDILKEPIGKQDQYAAAYGGFNVINFYKNGNVGVEPLEISKSTKKKLQENLLLFYTGRKRSASSILVDQKNNLIDNEERFQTQKLMKDLVDKAKNCLMASDLEGFGELLHHNWKLKQSLSNKISDEEINNLYNIAIKNGAIGGKLLGAGGGGFLLFYSKQEDHHRLRSALKSLKEIKFEFESSGTQLINF